MCDRASVCGAARRNDCRGSQDRLVQRSIVAGGETETIPPLEKQSGSDDVCKYHGLYDELRDGNDTYEAQSETQGTERERFTITGDCTMYNTLIPAY